MNFNEWWNEDYDDSENPFQKDSFGYWAYAGWCAATQVEKREWVGLTDEDIYELRRNGAHSVSDKDFRAIEAKLKEKNNA